MTSLSVRVRVEQALRTVDSHIIYIIGRQSVLLAGVWREGQPPISKELELVRLMLKLAVGLVAASCAGVAFGALHGSVGPVLQTPLPERATVTALAGGGSFDVLADGHATRIRLANVDVPGPAGPDQDAQCLGPETTAFIAELMPAGTPVSLAYDKDRFGRAIATVTTPNGRSVNAELARAGLAQVISPDKDSPVPAALLAAAREAVSNKRGFYSPDTGCSVPGQVRAVQSAVDRVPTTAPLGTRGPGLGNAANAATDARTAADELLWRFQQGRQDLAWRILDQNTKSELQNQLQKSRDQVAAAEVMLRDAASRTSNQEATQTAAQAEAARVAKQQAAIRAAAERRAALAARRAEAARQARVAAARAAETASQKSESNRSDPSPDRTSDSRRIPGRTTDGQNPP